MAMDTTGPMLAPDRPVGSAGEVEPAIRAVGLVKRFGPVAAVDGMTFDLAPGRIYGLLGPNGSGKTTLIRLLTGMTKATEGHAEVLGVRMPSRENLARIGYMTQSDGIYPALTAGENARFFAAAYGVRDAAAVTEALALVDLGGPGEDHRRDPVGWPAPPAVPRLRPRPSPAGPVPRRAHGRAWTRCSGSSSGATSGTLADAGATIVVSSHVMDEADRCDELLFMRAGRVIARGSGRRAPGRGRHRRPRGRVPARSRGDGEVAA